MGPQDISFESMARHHRAIAEVVRARTGRAGRGRVRDRAATRRSSSPTWGRASSRRLSVDQTIEDLRPKVMAIPALFTFLQNPPPITVSGQFGTNAYQSICRARI